MRMETRKCVPCGGLAKFDGEPCWCCNGSGEMTVPMSSIEILAEEAAARRAAGPAASGGTGGPSGAAPADRVLTASGGTGGPSGAVPADSRRAFDLVLTATPLVSVGLGGSGAEDPHKIRAERDAFEQEALKLRADLMAARERLECLQEDTAPIAAERDRLAQMPNDERDPKWMSQDEACAEIKRLRALLRGNP